ncbi:MAG: trans-4-hydroxy-L-proline dehydratase [Euryarchaeota archaeon]|nr:trans-4-hydroxy-L-proline dehydratase [Euryarchaeota archaeon]
MGIEDELNLRKSTINPINERIKKLREKSVNENVKISLERAELITEFYESEETGGSAALLRALSFKYLMENVSLPVEKDQLIVGIRGTGVKEVPTYPEVCCHGLEDLATLNSREKNPYIVDEKTKEVYENKIIPFWKGKTIRERIFKEMSKEWKTAYDAGIFTEFMEQRVPGHTAGGKRIFTTGLTEIKEEIRKNKKTADCEDELRAMEIVADAMITYAKRYAEKLEKMAEKEKNAERTKELEKMAEICRSVPAHAPQTFWEALQHYWFIHVGIVTESNPWDSFNPGRLDQHLFPFYKTGLARGKLTRERAKELLEAFWLKFNAQPAPPKVGVTAEESNTYNDFTKINIGGLKGNGSAGVNEISYLLLEVLEEMRTVQPNTAVLISKRLPNRFLERALKVMRPGFGEPPFFNHDGIVKILLRQGKSTEDARTGGVSGCVETGAFGKESYILTGYLNLPKILEITLYNGIDPQTGEKIGMGAGNPSNFNELFEAFKEQLKYFVDLKIRGNDIIEELYAEELPVPFLSLWIEDCVKNGTDYNDGGARYNTQYIQIVGLGTVTDSLSSLKWNVFDKKRFTLREVRRSLKENYEDEEMRQIFLNRTPKYGNDNDYADEIAKTVLDTCVAIIENNPPSPARKATRRVYGLPTTVHVYFGTLCGATPDGRKAKTALSEGISPVQGADKEGIGAVFKTIAKLDHIKTGGTLLNQKVSPDLFQEKGIMKKMGQLMRAYFNMGAHHVQYNVVSADLLREAQKRPEEFQSLMVRVAGYSDYFINLPGGLQDEIIKRSEQKGF